jgi:hypothetical protein
MPINELGLFFAASGKQSESWSQTRVKAILELFSASTGRWVAKVRAGDNKKGDQEPPSKIYWPTLSILGATTPSTLYDGLSEESFTNGMIARWIFISIEQEPPLQRVDSSPEVPKDLVAALKDARSDLPKVGDRAESSFAGSLLKPLSYTVPRANEEAAEEYYKIPEWARAVGRDPERGTEHQAIGRTGEIVAKLATIRAISSNPAAPAVSVDDLRWGLGIARISHTNILRDAERHMSGSDFETLVKAIKEHVRKAGPEGIKNSELLRKSVVRKAKPFDLKGAIDRLIDSDEIRDTGNRVGVGRRGGRYVLAAAATPS